MGACVALGVAVGDGSTRVDEAVVRALAPALRYDLVLRHTEALATEGGWPFGAYVTVALPVLLAGGAALLASRALPRPGARERWRWPWALLALLAVPVQMLLRELFGRAGPRVVLEARGLLHGAYPSGAALALGLAAGIALVVVAEVRPRWLRLSAVAVALLLAVHLAVRAAMLKHWATDVAGSYLLAAGAVLLALASRPGGREQA